MFSTREHPLFWVSKMKVPIGNPHPIQLLIVQGKGVQLESDNFCVFIFFEILCRAVTFDAYFHWTSTSLMDMIFPFTSFRTFKGLKKKVCLKFQDTCIKDPSNPKLSCFRILWGYSIIYFSFKGIEFATNLIIYVLVLIWNSFWLQLYNVQN